MSYQTPKTDWNEAYTPTPSDMNRIEGNVEDNRSEILLEESARIAADSVLSGNIGTLEGLKISNNDMGPRTYTTGTLTGTNTYTIPVGTYYLFVVAGTTSAASIQARDSGGTWRSIGFSADTSNLTQWPNTLVISDGTNLRIENQLGTTTWNLFRIA
jgi:hypothetical protein